MVEGIIESLRMAVHFMRFVTYAGLELWKGEDERV
jgi:hypothetical protein